MKTILKYRIPGEKIIELKGFLKKVNPDDRFEGFIVSDFTGQGLWLFQEDEIIDRFYFNNEEPFVISRESYMHSAERFLSELKNRKIGKAVFSRIKSQAFDEKKCDEFFSELEKTYPNAFVYFISAESLGTWIGASPEILIQCKGKMCQTMSLAGTLPAGDQQWQEKEKDEQQQVTDYILENLKKNSCDTIQSEGPYEFLAGPVKHLRNDITFNLKDITVAELALNLHPTPAVCGLPVKEALDLINTFEQHNRSLYTGLIGITEENKSNLYVNLRCCQIQKGNAYLYLGGGFTKDSIVEKEWDETENKSKTLLNIIQKL